jgi:transcriptional regulator with XRE-family HTH domain
VRLGEKLADLRERAGRARGLGRPLSKVEVARLMRAELGASVSHAYLSQLELGRRVHLSAHTRELLARFFRVHPGYLVDDPSDGNGLAGGPDGAVGFDNWLAGPPVYRHEPSLERVMAKLSNIDEPDRYLALFERLLDLPIEATEVALRAHTGVEWGAEQAGA